MPQSNMIRVDRGSGRTSQTRSVWSAAAPVHRSRDRPQREPAGDAPRERRTVETVEAECLDGRAARRPALDAEDREARSLEQPGGRQLTEQRVAEATDRGMVLEDEESA